MSKTKKFQNGDILNQNNLQSNSVPSNDAIDLTGASENNQILFNQINNISSSGGNSPFAGVPGVDLTSGFKDPLVSYGITDPTIVSYEDSPERYQTNFQGDWPSMLNDHRNRVKEFRIMKLQDQTANYQNYLDLMDKYTADVDDMAESGRLSVLEATGLKEQIKAGAFNDILSQGFDDTFNEYMNAQLFGSKDISQWLNKDVMGKFVDEMAKKNQEDVKAGYKDQGSALSFLNTADNWVNSIFTDKPQTYEEFQKQVLKLGKQVNDKKSMIDQERPDWTGTYAGVNPNWVNRASKSRLNEETFMSSIPIVGKISGLLGLGKETDLGGDNYFRYQSGEDLAGTMSTFEGHIIAGLGALAVGIGAKKLGLPKSVTGRLLTKTAQLGAIGSGLAYSREAEGSMELGESYWRKVDAEIAREQDKLGRLLNDEEKREIRVASMDGMRDMRIKNRMLVGNDMAQFALTWFALKGFSRTAFGRNFVNKGAYARLNATYPGRMGINAARYGTFVNMNRQMEGWEEGQQWKWSNDFLSGYSSNHGVMDLAGDFWSDGKEVAKAMMPHSMHDMVGANPDIYNNHAFKEAVQSGRDMGTMMVAGPRLGRGIMDYNRFRQAVTSLGKDGEAFDAEIDTKVKAADMFKHFKNGTVKHLLSAIYKSAKEGLMTEQEAEQSIDLISDAKEQYDMWAGQKRFGESIYTSEMQDQLGMSGRKSIAKSLGGVKPLNEMEQFELFQNAMQVARLKKSLTTLNDDKQSWLENQEEQSESWLESDFMSQEEKDQVRNTLQEKGLGETPFDLKIKESEQELKSLQLESIDLIGDKNMLTMGAHGIQTVNRKRYEALNKYEVDSEGNPELVSGIMFEIAGLERLKTEGKLTPEGESELKALKQEAEMEQYEMIVETSEVKRLRKQQKLKRSLALFNASTISQLMTENPRGNLGTILEEMLDRNIKIDNITLDEVSKLQRYYHHYSKQMQASLQEAQGQKFMLGADKMTTEKVERLKTLRKFKEEGSITGEQEKELATLANEAEKSFQINKLQEAIDGQQEATNDAQKTSELIKKFRNRRDNDGGYSQFLMDDSEFGELTDDQYKKMVADQFIFDNLEYIQSNVEANETFSDQNIVERALKGLKKLKNIFTLRDREQNPWITDELLTQIDTNIDKLEEYLTVVTDRVNDRTREQYIYENDVFNSLMDVIGFDFENLEAKTQMAEDVERAIGSENVIKWREDIKSGKLSDKHAAALLLIQMALESKIDTSISSLKKDIDAQKKAIIKNEALKRVLKITGRTEKSIQPNIDEYMAAPRNQFSFILNLLMDVNDSATGLDDQGAYQEFTVHKNLHKFLRDVQKAEERPEDKTLTKDELVGLIQDQISLEGKMGVYEYINSDFRIDAQIASEFATSQNAPQGAYPSKQQVIAIRNLVQFIKSTPKISEDNLYSAWVYLKSPAGTGKTKVILPWMLNTSGIGLEDVLAIGHNDHSSETLASALGKEKPFTIPMFLDLATNNGVSDDIKLLMIDEVAGIDDITLENLGQAVAKINSERSKDNILKVVVTGDPNQITADYSGQYAPIDAVTVEIVTPISTVYRTDVAAITNFQDLFRGKTHDVAGSKIDVKMNATNPYGVRKTDEVIGVWGTNTSEHKLKENIIRRLRETTAEDKKTRAIITLPENIEHYQELLKEAMIEGVEVLEVTEAQGRSISEVYVDLPKDPKYFKDNRSYNRAIYTASSRAERFLMIGNLDIKNHADLNLGLASGRTSEQLIERGKEYLTEVQGNLDWVKAHGKELNYSDPGALSKEEEDMVEDTNLEEEGINETIETKIDKVEEVELTDEVEEASEEDQQDIEAFTNTVEEVEEWSEHTQQDFEDLYEGEELLLGDNQKHLDNNEFHLLRFPEYASVKGYYSKDSNGLPVWHGENIEGTEIANIAARSEDGKGAKVLIVKAKVQKKDAKGKMKIVEGLVLITRAKDMNGFEVSYKQTRGLYQRVAVLGEGEIDKISFLKDTEKAELKRVLADKNASIVKFDSVARGILASPDGTTSRDIDGIALLDDVYIRGRQRLNYEYAGYEDQDRKFYTRVPASEFVTENKNVVENMISQFISDFYSDYQRPANSSALLKSKVRVYTDSDIKNNVDNIKQAQYKVKAGVPYLVLDNVETEGTQGKAKKQFVQMRPRKISSQIQEDYQMYLAPIEEFVETVERIQDMTGLIMGTNEFREFMKSQFYPEAGNSDKKSRYEGKSWTSIKQQIWLSMPQKIDPNSEEGQILEQLRAKANDLHETQVEYKGEVRKQTGRAQHAIHLLAKANSNLAIMQKIDGKNVRMGKGLFSMGGKFQWNLDSLRQWFVEQDSQGYLMSGIRIPINLKTFRYGEASKAFNGQDEVSTNRKEAGLNLENILVRVHPTSISIERGTEQSPRLEDSSKRKTKEKTEDKTRRKNVNGRGRSRDFMDNFGVQDLKGNKVSNKKAKEILGQLMPDLFTKNGRAKLLTYNDGKNVTTGFEILSALELIKRTGAEPNTLGRFMNHVIYLVNDGSGVYENVIRHEVGHKVVAHYLTEGERVKLFQAAREHFAESGRLRKLTKELRELRVISEQESIIQKMSGDTFQEYTTEAEMQAIENQIRMLRDKAKFLDTNLYSDEMIEEKLFRDFMILDKDTSISATLRKYIKKILKFFGIVNKNVTEIDKFFQNIDNGYFSDFKGEINVEAPTRNFQDIVKDFGSVSVYRVAKKRFLMAYHDLLYNDSKEGQEIDGDFYINPALNPEEALKETVEIFREEAAGFLQEGETVADLKGWESDLYKAFSALSKTSILRSLHNELYRKKVKTLYEESSERFEDTEVELSNVDLRDHILSAKGKDSVNSLRDHTLDFINSVSYKVGDETKMVGVRNGYFRLLQLFYGMDMDMTQEKMVTYIDAKFNKLGGAKNLAGLAVKDAVIDLINKAHTTDYNFKSLPTNIQFYDEDLFLLSKDDTINISKEYNPKVQSNENVIAIKRRRQGSAMESSSEFWGRIMKALKDNKIEVEAGGLHALYIKEIASKALRNIYNNTANKREEKLKVGQYRSDYNAEQQTVITKFKWFLRKTFGNQATIEQKIESFIEQSVPQLKKKLITTKLLKKIQKNPAEGIEDFFNIIKFPFDNHVINASKGSEIAIALKFFLTDLNTIGDKIKDVQEIEDAKGNIVEKKITREKTLEDVINDHSTLFDLLSSSLNATDSRAKSQSIRNIEGNVVHKYHDSSFGDEVIISLADNVKPEHLQKKAAGYESFYKYNIFVGDTDVKNKITSIQDLDGIEDANNYSSPRLYKRESKPEWLERNFTYMFLTGLKSTGSNFISYDQQLYTISDKPSPVGATVRVLSKEQVRDAVAAIVNQHDAKSKSTKKIHTSSEQRVRNEEGFLVGKHNASHAIMFEDILNNGKSSSQRTKDILKAINEHTLETLNYITENNIKLPQNLISIAKKLTDKNVLAPLGLDIGLAMAEGVTGKDMDAQQEVTSEMALSALVSTFVQNYAVNSFFLNQLVVGDQGAFKNEYDLIKRMSIVFAPGTAGTINQNFGMKEKFKVAVMEDPKGSAFDYLTQREYNKLQDDLKNIHGITFDLADAQGLMTPERAADIMRGFPGLNLGKVMKGVYAKVDNNGILRTMKYSSIVLSDELISKQPKLKKVLEEMRKNEVDETVFASGFKNGQPLVLSKHGYKTIVNVNGNNVVTKTSTRDFNPIIHTDSIVELSNKGFRIQLDPIADVNALVANMSQLTYLINTNGNNRTEAAEYYKVTSEIMEMGLHNFLGELGLLNASGQVKTYRDVKNKESVRSKVRSRVLASMKALESGQKEAEMLNAKVTTQKGNTFVTENAVDLNFPGLVNKVVSTLSSQFSKSTVSFRLPGSKLVLQSSYGIDIYQTTEGILTYDDLVNRAEAEGVTLSAMKRQLNAKERELKHITGSKPYVEVIMPAIYREQIPIGSDVYQKTDQGNILGFRIPSTELHSAIALRVVGFYDSSETNVIITPKEVVPLHGSDFDVDSLFIIRRAIMMDKDKNGRYIYATNAEGLVDALDPSNILIPIDRELNFEQAEHIEGLITADLLNQTLDKNQIKALNRNLKKIQEIKLAAKKNRLLEIYLDVIQADKNRMSMMTPISLDLINGQENSVFSDFAKKLGVQVNELLPTKNLMLPLDESHMHQSNKDGAQLVGQFANLMKAMAYMFSAGEQVMAKDYKGRKRFTNLTPKLVDSNGNDISFNIDDVDYGQFHRYEISKNSSGKIVKSDYTIWQTLDMFINAAIDNAKEQILYILNINNNTGSELALMIGFGVPLKTATNIVSQPIVRQIGTSNKGQYQAMISARSALKNELLEKGMTEAQYEALSNKDVKITSSKLNKSFDKKNNKIKELSDLTKNELIFQHQVLRLFNTLIIPAKNLNTISRELNILKKLPGTFNEIASSKEAWEQITGETEETTEYISNKGEGIQFTIPQFLNRNPHIRSAIKSVSVLHDLIGAMLPKHAPQLVDFSNKMINGYSVEFGETPHSVSEYVRGEFTKYLAASYYNTDQQETTEYLSYGSKKVTIGGIDAFNETLIDQIKNHEDKNTNGFLSNLLIVKRKSGLRYMKYSNAAGLNVEEIHGIYEQFEKLSPNLKEDIVKYATLNEGLAFGASNITMVLNPTYLSKVDTAINTLARKFAYTDKGVTQLNNLRTDFLIQFALNNYKTLPSHYKIDSSARTETTKSSIVDFGGVESLGESQILYDIKTSKDLRSNPPLLMSNQKNGAVYIRVYMDELEEGGHAYYQKVGDGQEAFSTSKYTSDKTVGDLPYDHSVYFRKDVLTRAIENLFTEEGEIKQEIIYTPRNNKKIRGVQDGGNMILRTYDDHTRKRAVMYNVLGIVDNWGKDTVKKIAQLEEKINSSKTDKTIEKYNKQLDDLLDKTTKKSKNRYDYILGQPASLHLVEPTTETIEDINETPTVDIKQQKIDKFAQEQDQETVPKQIMENILKKLQARFGIEYKIENDKNLLFKGKFQDGIAVVNLAYATLDTPFHEIAHPWVASIRKSNKPLYTNLRNAILSEGNILNGVKRRYPELSEEDQIEEAIVEAIGKYAGKAITNTGSVLFKVIEKLMKYLKRVWKQFMNKDYIIKPGDLNATTPLNILGYYMAYGESKIMTSESDFMSSTGISIQKIMADMSTKENISTTENMTTRYQKMEEESGTDQTKMSSPVDIIKELKDTAAQELLNLSPDQKTYAGRDGKYERLTNDIQKNFGNDPDKVNSESIANSIFENYKKSLETDKVTLNGVEYTYTELVSYFNKNAATASAYGSVAHKIMQINLAKRMVDQGKETEATIAKLRAEQQELMQAKGDQDEIHQYQVNWLEQVKDIYIKMLGITDSDNISAELMLHSPIMGVATQIDVLVQKPNGTLHMVDYKSGSRFYSSDTYAEYMPFADGATSDIYNTKLNRAKLELTMRAIMIKEHSPKAKFSKIIVHHLDRSNLKQEPEQVNLEDFLPIIGEFYKRTNSDIYNKLKTKGLLDFRNYLAKDENITKDIFIKGAAMPIKERIEYYKMQAELLSNRLSMNESTNPTRDEKDLRELTDELMKTQQSSKGDLDGSENLGVFKQWVGMLWNIGSKRIQTYTKMWGDHHDSFMKDRFNEQAAFRQYVENIRSEYVASRSVKGAVAMVTARQINLLNMRDMWSFYWVYRDSGIQNSPGYYAKTVAEAKKEFKDGKLTQAQHDIILYMHKRQNEEFSKVTTKTAYVDKYGYKQDVGTMLNLKNRTDVTKEGKLTEYFAPRLPASGAEILERYENDSTISKTGKRARDSFRDWKRRNLSFYYEKVYQEDYVTAGNLIPIQFLGNSSVISSGEHSFDVERMHLEFMNSLFKKNNMDPALAFAQGLKGWYSFRKIAKLGTKAGRNFKRFEAFMEKEIMLNILNRKMIDADWASQDLTVENPFNVDENGIPKKYKINLYQAMMAMKDLRTGVALWLRVGGGTFNGAIITMYTLAAGMKGSIAKRVGVPESAIDFSMGDIRFGMREVRKYFGSQITGTRHKNKLYNLMNRYNYLPDNYDYAIDKSDLRALKNPAFRYGNLFFFHAIHEEWGHAVLLAAQMKKMKHTDGSSIWDNYDNKGNWLEYKIDKNTGKKKYNARFVKKDAGGLETVVTDLTTEEIQRMYNVSTLLHGGYRRHERTMMEAHALGSWFLQFKKYLPSLLASAWQGKQSSQSLGWYENWHDGNTEVYNGLVDKNGNRPENLQTITTTDAAGNQITSELPAMEWTNAVHRGRAYVVLGMFARIISLGKTGDRFAWSELSPRDKEGAIDFLTKAAMLTFIMQLSLAVAEGDGEEEEFYGQKLQFLASDMMQGYNPLEIARTAKLPFATVQMAHDFSASFMEVMGNGIIGGERTRDGQIRGLKQLSKNVPFWSVQYELNRYGLIK